MKKRMSKILSALLVSALVMSTGNVVQAEDAGETASGKAKVEAEAIPQPETGVQTLEALGASEAAKEITTKATTGENTISLNRIKTGKEDVKKLKIGSVFYDNTTAYKKGGNNRYGYGEQVKLKKGTLYLTVKSEYSTSNVWFGLYKDKDLTKAVDGETWVASGGTYSRWFKVKKEDTYYIGVYSKTSSVAVEGAEGALTSVGAIYYDGSDRTVTSGKQVAVGVKDAQTTYFKLKVKKAGYITVPCVDLNSRYYSVTLCNSKKKALSGATPLGYDPTYGVKKGTYYIKVKSSSNSAGGYAFKVTSNSSIKEKSGKSKAKAVTLKKKATKKGTIQAGSSQADWYKFKKGKEKQISAVLRGKTNDKLKLTLYRGGKKVGSKTFDYRHEGCYIALTNYPKGTYYVKIERGNKKSSGRYSVQWINGVPKDN